MANMKNLEVVFKLSTLVSKTSTDLWEPVQINMNTTYMDARPVDIQYIYMLHRCPFSKPIHFLDKQFKNYDAFKRAYHKRRKLNDRA